MAIGQKIPVPGAKPLLVSTITQEEIYFWVISVIRVILGHTGHTGYIWVIWVILLILWLYGLYGLYIGYFWGNAYNPGQTQITRMTHITNGNPCALIGQ